MNFDYSAVRTPVLDFLFQHELFRIELREKYGRRPVPIHTDPSKEAERQDKRRNTLRANMRALFKGVFAEYGTDMRMGTTAIKQNMGRDAGSVLKALYTLEEDGCVARVGTLKAGSGREQIIWEWIGE